MRASFEFFGALNDFLPRRRKAILFEHEFEHSASIKDMIESLGVPHPEIELIVVDGVSVDFNYLVQGGETVRVYPFFYEVEITPQIRLRPDPPAEAKFVLDTHLGKLANYLRMLGFDTLYSNKYADDELAYISSTEDRIVLTRDFGVLKRSIVKHGYFMRNTDPQQQILEILQRYNLMGAVRPFNRCLNCNGMLHHVEKEAVAARLPPNATDYYNDFHQCGTCQKVYWRGSHYERMLKFVDDIIKGR